MRAPDRESFESWAVARQQGLVRAAYLLTGDHHRAEDLVQEALVRAAMRWDHLANGNPDAWIRTVIFREQVSWWRRHRRERVMESVPDRHGAGPGENRVLLQDALAGLTRKQRAIVLLRYVEDLSVAETAAILGVSEGTIKKQASVALARLRETAPELDPQSTAEEQ